MTIKADPPASEKMALLGALDHDWRRLSDLGLGPGKRLVTVAKSMPDLVECKMSQRWGHLVWRLRG